MIELREVFQIERFQSSFDPNASGFDRQWWSTSTRGLDTSEILLQGKVVGRVAINPRCVMRGYRAPRTPWHVVEVVKFAIHEEYQSRGIGEKAVERFIDVYPVQDLVAFSAEAVRFWELRAKWVQVPRVDGSTHHVPLFASLNDRG